MNTTHMQNEIHIQFVDNVSDKKKCKECSKVAEVLTSYEHLIYSFYKQWRTQDFSTGEFQKWHQKFVRNLYFGK